MSGARSSSATATTGIGDPRAVPTGRFAPSPTGPLHFGSLVAALGSYLDARAGGGRWLVRIEDLDPPRERSGAADQILRGLERLGLEWDGPVWRQSGRSEHYEAAIDRLRDVGSTRFCACSRSGLKALPQNLARASGDELYHPKQCVSGADRFGSSALRFRVPHGPIGFDDRSLGRRIADVASEVGDFVLKRRDGLYAYQLAVVIDDAAQGVTDVVRGSDLLSSTARQMLLQRALGLPAVTYLHLPLAVAADGTKLSKSGDAPAFAEDAPGRMLWRALAWLGQRPPDELNAATAAEVLSWGVAHWQPRGFAGVVSRPAAIAGISSRLQDTQR